MSSFDFMNVCRLCLAKDGHLHPIFGGESEVPTISLKITSCLPVKIAREDKLPQKICEQCLYKLDLSYEFWNLTVETEKQLLQWLSGVNSQNYAVTTILNQDIMKGEQSNENRLDGSMMQQVSGHQNSMNMGIDNMCISMIMPNNNQQQITSVPIDTSGSSVQNVQVIAGSSTQTTHDQITQSQTNVSTQQEEEEESSEDEENSDDECDGDEGLPIKEESEEDPNNSRTIEPTTFVNVSLHCDEAGPSGIRQQKITDIQEMTQATDVDPKTGLESIAKTCDKCQEKFYFVSRLVAHLRIVHGIERPFTCITCGKNYPQLFMLNAHVKKTHMPKTIPCSECSFMGVSANDVERHQKRIHRVLKFICEICSENFDDNEALVTHTATHDSMESQRCSACDKVFDDVFSLKEHNRLHHYDHATTSEKDFPVKCICDICDKMYKYRSLLEQHQENVHGKLKRERRKYLCALCGKQLKTLKGLEIHNRSHTGEKPYTCEVCGKCFACETLLKTHSVIHTGERKYSCDQCGKTFTQRSTLVIHKRYHTGERPYICLHCGKGFVTRTFLNSHISSCHRNELFTKLVNSVVSD